jgi:hypothetical protein
MATWRELIAKEMNRAGETWADVVSMTLSQPELDSEFDDGIGSDPPTGISFALWTHGRVYFPVKAEWGECVGSASRHPDGKPIEHVGF